MSPVFGSRRRADEFDLLLSRTSPGPGPDGGHDVADPAHSDLLRVVSTLRAVPTPEVRADFSTDLRSRLLLAAETALAPDTDAQREARRAPAVRRSPRERRIVAAVSGFAIVSATASMAVAAQSALPGDTLYPLKRALENASAGVQRDADEKGSTLLDNAMGRLAEVDALSRSGEDPTTITTTLEDFVTQASEASDLLLGDYASTGQGSSIKELRSFTADSMGSLTTLQDLVPDEARASLVEATKVINAIDVRAQGLCPACTDLPILEAPVYAEKKIDTVIAGPLGAVPTVAAPGSQTSPKPQPQPQPQQRPPRSTTPDPRPSTAEPSETGQTGTPPTILEDPVLPQGPTGTAGDGTGAGAKDGDKRRGADLLEDLEVSGSDDPIGDLLTGAGETLDEATTGDGGLGGLGKG